MAEENYSTYQWKISHPNQIEYNITTNDRTVTVHATITGDNVFALIAGKYQVDVKVTYDIMNISQNRDPESTEQSQTTGLDGDDIKYSTITYNETLSCISEMRNLKLCNRQGNYSISFDLTGTITEELVPSEALNIKVTYEDGDFGILQGDTLKKNDYLYILQKPELITNLTINGSNTVNTYVKGSALPINEIGNISTIDFQNITINDVQRDIFSKLENNMNITTNTLDVNELTVVDLPESEDKQIVICKSRSKNKGITFKTKDPDIRNKHFGYVIDIEDDRSAGYNSVWVNRETLNKMFKNMPDDIMSTTDKFEYKDKSFKFRKLTYAVHDVAAPNWVNNEGQLFNEDDANRLIDYAPTYKVATINESTGDPIRHNNMLLKNIEFVKFGDKVIKLNYKPLYEA